MDEDEMGAIFHRLMRDLDADDREPNRKPRCEGCGARLPLQPYRITTEDGGGYHIMYCAQCRALAESLPE
jgi:hypothetical protein